MSARRVATVDLLHNGFNYTAVLQREDHAAIEYTAETAHGALHGMANQVKGLAEDNENDGTILREIEALISTHGKSPASIAQDLREILARRTER